MKMFEYKSPLSIQEAHKLTQSEHKRNLLYAGGTDILSLIKHNIEKPDRLVNLKSIEGLRSIDYKRGSGFRIGALVSVAELIRNDDVKSALRLLHQAAVEVASPQLRNMATIGGNLCQRPRCWYFRGAFQCLRKGGDMCYAIGGENKYHCIIGGDPCFIVHPSDLAVALTGLDAVVHVSDDNRSVRIPIDSFFVLPEKDYLRENVLTPSQIITHIEIPEQDRTMKSLYKKVKERGSWDFAIISVGAMIKTAGKSIKHGKLVFGGVAPIPWTDSKINQNLSGLRLDADSIKEFSDTLLADAIPLEQNAYKHTMTRNLVFQILSELSESN